MDWILNPVSLGLLALLLVALVVAWWEHRKRLREVQRRLTASEQSRRELALQAQVLGAQLGEARAALAAGHDPGTAARRAALGRAAADGVARLDMRERPIDGRRPEERAADSREPRAGLQLELRHEPHPAPHQAPRHDPRHEPRHEPRRETVDAPAAGLDERAARMAAVSAVVDRMAEQRSEPATWADTQPLALLDNEIEYPATMPAPLDLEPARR